MNTKAVNYDNASIKERKYIYTQDTDNTETKLWSMATVAANPTFFPKFSPGAVCCGRTSPAWGILAGPTVSAGRPVTVVWARLLQSELNQQTGILNHCNFCEVFFLFIDIYGFMDLKDEELTLRSADPPDLLFLLLLRDALRQVLFLPTAKQMHVNVRRMWA